MQIKKDEDEKMKKFRMNRKGISPIFATLILIAIAVIAGVVVYAFTSGWLSGMSQNTTAAQERLTVSGASYDDTTGFVSVYVQNTEATGKVTITGLLVKNSAGTIAAAEDFDSVDVAQIDGLVTVPGTVTIPESGTYTVTVTTAGGGNFVSPSFTAIVEED